jgi:hypothetical protein
MMAMLITRQNHSVDCTENCERKKVCVGAGMVIDPDGLKKQHWSNDRGIVKIFFATERLL